MPFHFQFPASFNHVHGQYDQGFFDIFRSFETYEKTYLATESTLNNMSLFIDKINLVIAFADTKNWNPQVKVPDC